MENKIGTVLIFHVSPIGVYSVVILWLTKGLNRKLNIYIKENRIDNN